MQAKNIRTLNVTYVNEKKATKNNWMHGNQDDREK
jgi:hypothetical protein